MEKLCKWVEAENDKQFNYLQQQLAFDERRFMWRKWKYKKRRRLSFLKTLHNFLCVTNNI